MESLSLAYKILIYIWLLFSLPVAKLVIDKKIHPKGLFHLFLQKCGKGFHFYGMRALLVLYIVKCWGRDIENK